MLYVKKGAMLKQVPESRLQSFLQDGFVQVEIKNGEYITKNTKQDEIEQLKSANDALTKENKALKREIAKLKKEPTD